MWNPASTPLTEMLTTFSLDLRTPWNLPNRTYHGELLKLPSCCCTTTMSTAPPNGWNGPETVYTLREMRLLTFPTAYILPPTTAAAAELPDSTDHQTVESFNLEQGHHRRPQPPYQENKKPILSPKPGTIHSSHEPMIQFHNKNAITIPFNQNLTKSTKSMGAQLPK
jgi:hypothetical protein